MTVEAAPTSPPVTPTQPPPGVDVPQGTTPLPGSAETPVKGEEKLEEQEQPVTLPDGWRDSEDAKTLRAEGYQQAQSEKDKELRLKLAQQETSLTEQRNQAVQAALASAHIVELRGAIDALQSSFSDPEQAKLEVDKLLGKHKDWAAAFNGVAIRAGEQSGREMGINEASIALYDSLPKEQVAELEEFIVTEINPKIVKGQLQRINALKEMLGKRDELMEAALTAKVEKLVQERLEAESKARNRDGQKPPVGKLGGRASGVSPDLTTRTGVLAAHRAGSISEEEAGSRLRALIG